MVHPRIKLAYFIKRPTTWPHDVREPNRHLGSQADRWMKQAGPRKSATSDDGERRRVPPGVPARHAATGAVQGIAG